MGPDTASILVVEDEPLTRATFAQFLRSQGYEVRQASDAAACRAALKAQPAHVVLLDLGLPGEDGLSLARELREQSDVGVIVVTSRAGVREQVAALDGGADDYLIKPVDLEALGAHVRSLLRRRRTERGQRYRFAEWTLDLGARALRSAQGPLMVTRGEFDLLALLVTARGKIVSREHLAEAVNRNPGLGDVRSVDALVSRLRRKLAAAREDGGALIVTAPGFGYRLDAAVEAE
jgi:two-component system torCAD operon response regulator TorR